MIIAHIARVSVTSTPLFKCQYDGGVITRRARMIIRLVDASYKKDTKKIFSKIYSGNYIYFVRRCASLKKKEKKKEITLIYILRV